MKYPHGLTAADVTTIRVAWSLYDDARDKGDLGLAKSILEGLEKRAKELGLRSAFDLSNL